MGEEDASAIDRYDSCPQRRLELPDADLPAREVRAGRQLQAPGCDPGEGGDVGGVTLRIQRESPGKAKEGNWLLAPEGDFIVILRLSEPKVEAVESLLSDGAAIA